MNAHAHAAHPPTATGLDTWKLGFWTFLGSETLFFGSFIATYMIYAGRSVTGPLPHEVLDIPLTSISTFVLLMSSLAMVIGLAGVQRGSRRAALVGIGMTAVLGMIFLWHARPDPENMAVHAQATFWYVLPSLPMFLLIPVLLRGGAPFWLSLALGCALTIGLYLLMAHFGPRLGIRL